MADVADDADVMTDLKQDSTNTETMKSNGEEVGDSTMTDEVKINGADKKAEAVADAAADGKNPAADGDKHDDAENDEAMNDDAENDEAAAGATVSPDRGDRKRGRGDDHSNSHTHTKPNNIKSTFELPESDDPVEIRRQVEFYFSDSNLPIDAYLLRLSGGYRNQPVELKTIHNFKRMRHFQPYSAVREAVKQSKFLDLNDKDQITRKNPLDKKFTDDATENRTHLHQRSMSRSIYAKGFGEETKDTHLDIEALFRTYGEINSVRLRRTADGDFRNSVFVEFADEATQQAFLALEHKPEWEGKELKIMSKQDYVDMKHEGIHEGTVKPKSPTAAGFGEHNERGGFGGRGRGRGQSFNNRDGRGSNDRFDKDDWKTRRDRDEGNDRRGRDGGRGRGRDRGGRGGRWRRSDDFEDKKRKRGDEDDDRDRGESKVKKANVDPDEEKNGEAAAGAETANVPETKSNGKVAEDGIDALKTKKRARVEDVVGDDQGEAKKVKESDES